MSYRNSELPQYKMADASSTRQFYAVFRDLGALLSAAGYQKSFLWLVHVDMHWYSFPCLSDTKNDGDHSAQWYKNSESYPGRYCLIINIHIY